MIFGPVNNTNTGVAILLALVMVVSAAAVPAGGVAGPTSVPDEAATVAPATTLAPPPPVAVGRPATAGERRVDDRGSGDTDTARTPLADGGNVTAAATGEETREPGLMRLGEPTGTREVTVEYEPNYSIDFWAGPYTPREGLDESVLRAERDRVWVLVGFYRDPTGQEQRTLDEYGYTEAELLTPNARIAGIPTGLVEPLAGLEFVRSVEPVRPEWRISPALDAAIREYGTDEEFAVTVLATTGETELPGVERVDDETFRGTVTGETVRELQQRQVVLWVEEDRPATVSTLEGRNLVGAGIAGQNPAFAGNLTGAGVRVGVIDSGIDYPHPHFANTTIVDAKDWVDGGRPQDGPTCTHGTHVAGTIAGNGVDRRTATDEDPRENVTVRGVAPDATLVVARMFAGDADCTDRTGLSGVKNRYNSVDQNVAVISNSWGQTGIGRSLDFRAFYDTSTKKTDKWAKAHPDVLLVFANGNFDPSNSDDQYVSSPALGKNVLAVGAVRDGSNRTGNVTPATVGTTLDDSFLNRLQPPVDINQGSGRRKPDVYAPGHWTTSSVVGGGYDELLGTSMATPHVSGVAALLEQSNPGLDANEAKTAIVATTHGPNYDGFGVVDANNAVFENRYENEQTLVSGSVKKPYKPLENQFKRTIQEKDHDFFVPNGTEQVVVTLGWVDPAHTPLLKGRDTLLVNDLELYAGPSGDPKRFRVEDNSNVKKLVMDVPNGTDGQRWTAIVRGRRVTAATTQDYDLVYRTVMEEPGFDIDAPDRVVAPVTTAFPDGGNVTFDVTLEGTGAPVGGTYAVVSADANLSLCGQRAFVGGTVSEGLGATQELCVTAPPKYGEYDVTIQADSATGQSATRNVTVVVPQPRVILEPFTRNVPVGGETDYRIVVHNVSDGVRDYVLTFSLERPDVGDFQGISFPVTPASQSVWMGSDNDTVGVEVDDLPTTATGSVTVGVLTASGESVGRTNVSIGVRELTNSSDVPYPIRTYPFGTRPPWDGELLVTEGSPSPTINTSDPEVGIPIEFDGSDVVTFDPVEIQWDFGDGTGATGSLVVEHTYAKPGNYTVTLTAVNADGLVESGQVVLSVAPASDETGSDAETTVDVILDGAPDGLRQYRVFLASTVDAPVTSIEPRLVGGQEFEVESGGVDSAGVTARATEVTSDTGTFTGRRALFSATFAGDHTRGAFALEVTDLVDDTGSPMSPGRVSLVVGDEVFSEPIPGTGGSTPTDTDGDGTYDDVDGNGVTDFGDVIALAFADTTALSDAQLDAVDFDSSGTYDFGDVITLAFAL